MNKGLIIYGAGDHGKVVADTAMLLKKWQKVLFVDDNAGVEAILGFPVVHKLSDIPDSKSWDIVVAIGNNSIRLSLSQSLLKNGYHLVSIVHPSAIVSRYASIGSGTVIFANAVLNAGVSMGLSCIVNTAATIDHDCQIADGVHISPGANLAGRVTMGQCCWIGIGAAVIQTITIGEHNRVGAGAVVINDLADNLTVAGVPAMVIT